MYRYNYIIIVKLKYSIIGYVRCYNYNFPKLLIVFNAESGVTEILSIF